MPSRQSANSALAAKTFTGASFYSHAGLVRFGARDYDPVVARWTSKDPIRFDGGQANLYVYVNNDAINSVDARHTGPALCIAAVAVCLRVTAYEAISTAMSYRECMDDLQKAAAEDPKADNEPEGDNGDSCESGPTPPTSSPDRDIAKGAQECLLNLGPGLGRGVAEDTVCGALVAAACLSPTP